MTAEGATWVGRAIPVNDTAAARKYWCSDASVKTIISEFAPGAHPAHFNKVVGPAVIDLLCLDCQKAKVATSRSDAQSDIAYAKRYRCSDCRRQFSINELRDRHVRYQAKAERAEELRWMPYRDYLGTDDWSERRKQVIRRAGFKCQVCASGGRLHVHHRTYARRGAERPEDMIALCADCHELFHAHGKLAESGRAA